MTLAVLISIALVFFTLATHYVAFTATTRFLLKHEWSGFQGLILAVSLISLAHVVEAAAFSAGFWFGEDILKIGTFDADKDMSAMDYFYFSLVNFTTLGRGDITPLLHLRFIAGIEAFIGFVMITASGSYVLQVMAGNPPKVGVAS